VDRGEWHAVVGGFADESDRVHVEFE
jgi:hypothetical protein